METSKIAFENKAVDELKLAIYKRQITSLMNSGTISFSTASRLINKARKHLGMPYFKDV